MFTRPQTHKSQLIVLAAFLALLALITLSANSYDVASLESAKVATFNKSDPVTNPRVRFAPLAGKRTPAPLANLEAPLAGRRSPAPLANLEAPLAGKRMPAPLANLEAPLAGRRTPAPLANLEAPLAGRRSPAPLAIQDIERESNARLRFHPWMALPLLFIVRIIIKAIDEKLNKS